MSNIKLSSVAWNGNLNSPQYQIAYSTVSSVQVARKRSREVLDKLFGDHDLIIELLDSFLSVPLRERPPITENFRKTMMSQNIALSERRYPSQAKVSFFAKILGQGGDEEACELRAFVPSAIWRSGAIDTALTDFGLRYFVLPKGTDGPALLERLNVGTMPAKECIETMELIIYDVPNFGQMGLISSHHDQAALQAKLNQ